METMETTNHEPEPALKEKILSALYAFANSRPGLDPRDYGGGVEGWRAYRQESRSITRDLRDARMLLRAVELSSVGKDALLDAFKRAYSGRLTCKLERKAPDAPHKVILDYCTGQYYPTEYRRAVCAVASSALWEYYREDFAATARKGESAGDAIRRKFRSMFGARVARRWFD